MKKDTAQSDLKKWRRQRPATIDDIATAAGVSAASVSRALNGTGRVGATTRVRILSVVEQLGYVPNPMARSLASRRSRVVGAVIPSLENLSFAIAMDAFRRQLRAMGYSLLLADSDYSQIKEEQQVKALVAQGVDAIMLIGGVHPAGISAFLRARNIPLLLAWTSPADYADAALAGLPMVGFENYKAARLAMTHLLDLGHSRIGIIAADAQYSDRSEIRLRAIRDILLERGLPPAQECLVPRSYFLSEGKAALQDLMRGTISPTAIFCLNDVLAFGALLAAKAINLAVPQDVSIIGFDDLEFSGALQPALTTIHVPAREIGQESAHYLVQLLEGAKPALPAPLPATLIVRDSSAAVR